MKSLFSGFSAFFSQGSSVLSVEMSTTFSPAGAVGEHPSLPPVLPPVLPLPTTPASNLAVSTPLSSAVTPHESSSFSLPPTTALALHGHFPLYQQQQQQQHEQEEVDEKQYAHLQDHKEKYHYQQQQGEEDDLGLAMPDNGGEWGENSGQAQGSEEQQEQQEEQEEQEEQPHVPLTPSQLQLRRTAILDAAKLTPLQRKQVLWCRHSCCPLRKQGRKEKPDPTNEQCLAYVTSNDYNRIRHECGKQHDNCPFDGSKGGTPCAIMEFLSAVQVFSWRRDHAKKPVSNTDDTEKNAEETVIEC
jgi:hypothetical protein